MRKTSIMMAMFSIGLASSALAANEPLFFKTLEEASKYCPMTYELSFAPNHAGIQHSIGRVTGMNHVVFESIPAKTARYPKYLSNHLIMDAAFRRADGIYGYLSNGTVTCLYSYTTFDDVKYALVLRSK